MANAKCLVLMAVVFNLKLVKIWMLALILVVNGWKVHHLLLVI